MTKSKLDIADDLRNERIRLYMTKPITAGCMVRVNDREGYVKSVSEGKAEVMFGKQVVETHPLSDLVKIMVY